jgi:dolichyl-phosphate beta-glucosyltransferase
MHTIISLALITFSALVLLAAVSLRFISDETLFDRMLLPPSHPGRLTYQIEPQPNSLSTVFSDPSVYVTLVVPAYNEEIRLPPMLDVTIRYLESRASANASFTWEILIVDDGSKDGTAAVALSYAARNSNIRLLRQPVNMGKGAAIQAGSLHARGRLILMLDADGATKIDDFGALELKLFENQAKSRELIVIGSRANLEDSEAKAQRTFVRKVLGLGFHFLTVLSGVSGIRDTQCGFKLFSREAARWLFSNQHIQRWCFDAEILVIGRRRGMQIVEVPVEWNEIEGSKMKVRSMIKMAIDLIQIAVFHRTGTWTVTERWGKSQ